MTMTTITVPRSIHVEGMDLAGKTMLTRALLIRRPEATLRRNALTADNPVYALADELRRCDGATARTLGVLYIAALEHDLERYAPPGTALVQDSTVLLRSLAYYTARGDTEMASAFRRLVAVHPRFGTSVVLTATIEARLGRLEARRRSSPEEVAPDDLMVQRNPELFMRMEEALVDVAVAEFDAVVVDTSTMTPDEISAQVEQQVSDQ